MADHLSEEHLGRFFRAEDVSDWQAVVGHLVTCELCLRRSLPWLDLLLIPEQVEELAEPVVGADAYDAAIDRAFQAVYKKLPRLRAEKKRLAQALAQEDPPSGSRGKQVRGLAGVMRRLHRSFELRYVDPEGMLREAFLARITALNLNESTCGPQLVADLRARVAAELANAYRVTEDFQNAAVHFTEAERYREQGTGDLLLLARIGDLKASFAIDERRFGDALQLIEGVRVLYEELGERHLAGRALVSQAIFEDYQGESSRALLHFREALTLLDPERDPRLFASTQLSALDALVACGEYQEASRILFSSGLRQVFAEEPLNLLKLRWVEAKILAGLGRLERAERAFADVRRGFMEHGRHYHAAVSSLDLAAVWLRQGQKLSQIAALASENLELFERLRFGREALRATRYLADACYAGIADVVLVQHVASFLTRYEHDPRLVFQAL